MRTITVWVNTHTGEIVRQQPMAHGWEAADTTQATMYRIENGADWELTSDGFVAISLPPASQRNMHDDESNVVNWSFTNEHFLGSNPKYPFAAWIADTAGDALEGIRLIMSAPTALITEK